VARGLTAEWKGAREDAVHEDACGPKVGLRAIFLALDDFGGHIRYVSRHGGQDVAVDAVIGDEVCCAKVSQSESHGESGFRAKDIVRADVAMDDIVGVEKGESGKDVAHDDTGVELGQDGVAVKEVLECAATHELHDNVDAVDGGEDVDGLDNIVVRGQGGGDVAFAACPFGALGVIWAELDDFDGQRGSGGSGTVWCWQTWGRRRPRGGRCGTRVGVAICMFRVGVKDFCG
jgi:hypothetical protein